jgi:signal transduction histidine kinase/DNA-binding response OmpR family regulator
MALLHKLSLSFFLLLPAYLFSQEWIELSDSISIFSGKENIVCQKNLYFFQSNLPIDTIVQSTFQNNFTPFTPNQILKKDTTYWVKFSLENSYKNGDFSDRFYIYGAVNVFPIHLYLENGNGFKRDVISALERSFERKYNYSPFWVYSRSCEMPFNGSDVMTYYAKVTPQKDIRQENFGFDIVSLKSIQKSDELMSYAILVYLGFLLMMTFYSLGLYTFMREPSFLYYALFCFFQLVFNATSYNILDALVIALAPGLYQFDYITHLFAHIAIFCFLNFVRTFLELKKYLPTWNKIFGVLGIMVLVSTLLELFFFRPFYPDNWWYENISRLHYLLTPIAISLLVFFFPLWKIKTKKKYFFFWGALSLLIGVIYVISLTYTNSFVGKASYLPFLFFCMIEVTLFALGLAYRIKENESDKQQVVIQLQNVKNEKNIKEIEAQKLQEINDLKTKLYTNITHEFRTPLTVIQGLVQGLRGNSEDKNIILRNSNQLLNLVNQLLDLSKLESDRYLPQPMQGDVVLFLKYLVESFKSLAETNDITLSFHSKKESVMMDFDEEMLQQIFSNLISNAIKFTEANGKIQVKVSANDTLLQVEVEDSGIGIDTDEIKNIFDRFYQIEGNYTRQTKGTGIGLSLVKELTESLGGKISVRSELGKGSSFICQLPITNEAVIKDSALLHNTNTTEKSTKPVTSPAKSEADQPIILIVEDNEDVIFYLQKCLRDKYQIHTAKTGIEGLHMAFEVIPDFIISDVMMPEMDGFELCKRLKSDIKTSHIPIVLLTAKVDVDSKIEGLKKGADAYLTKPFNKEELTVRINQLLNLRQTLQNHYTSTIREERKPLPAFELEDGFIKELNRHIIDNLTNDDFKPESLFRLMGMSRANLYRKLKALTNKSVNIYIRSIRLWEARKILQTTNKSVSEVCFEVGFNDLSYFSKSFKEEFGYSPSESS